VNWKNLLLNQPFVSVIIPCRNEEKFINKCLDSLVASTYPKDRLEILVVDGMSEDRTKEVVNSYSQAHPYIKRLRNPKKITPSAFNLGIRSARGDLIVLMGAHACYEKDYILKCVENIEKYKADNVGGMMKTIPRTDTAVGRAIASVLSHPMGVGNSTFRTGAKAPRWVKTVFGGCYRKEVFEKIGLFNEKLIKGQDMEFNIRLRKNGGKILLVPDIKSYYFARSSLGRSFIKFYFGEGFWALYPAKHIGIQFLSFWRLIPLFFVSSLLSFAVLSFFLPFFFDLFALVLFSYVFATLLFSFQISLKAKNFRLFFIIPLIFSTIHFCYGLGSGFAVIKMIFQK